MIPRFDTYYTDLHSSFIRFDKYMEFMKNEFLNGFVHINNNDLKAYLFMFEGEIQSCIAMTKDSFKKINKMDFFSIVKEESIISSFRCQHEYVDFFSRIYTAKLVYNNLSSDIISPVKLINRCKTDNFIGFIEADDSRNKKKYIYFSKGKILGALNLENNDGSFEKNIDINLIKKKIENTNINLYKLAEEVRDLDKDRKAVIKCYENILQLLSANAKGVDFSSIWRTSAIELGDKYYFLDPFAGEFIFKDNKIDLWEKVNTKDAAQGLNALCDKVAKKLKVPEKEIGLIKNKYIDVLTDYEIRK